MGPSLTLGEGRNASVSYTIEANPITNHILVRTDGRPVSSRITVSNTSIDYTGVNRNDAGEYRLSTTNEAGTAMTTFNLTVQCKFAYIIRTGAMYIGTLYWSWFIETFSRAQAAIGRQVSIQ